MNVLVDDRLRVPTTIARAGDQLLVVNSQLGMDEPELPFSVTALPFPMLET